jgi:hypothetical protein
MTQQSLNNCDPNRRVVSNIELCIEAIKQAHYELEEPLNADQKADLLIAVEALTYEALDLLDTTKEYVWGDLEEDPEQED